MARRGCEFGDRAQVGSHSHRCRSRDAFPPRFPFCVEFFIDRSKLEHIAYAKAGLLRPGFDRVLHIPELEHRNTSHLLLRSA